MNPFGDADDDIDACAFIDGNLEFSYLIVDKFHGERPQTLNDQYWFGNTARSDYKLNNAKSVDLQDIDEETVLTRKK